MSLLYLQCQFKRELSSLLLGAPGIPCEDVDVDDAPLFTSIVINARSLQTGERMHELLA